VKAAEQSGRRLDRTLGAWSLMALGIGAVIGSGIFVLTGTAAAGEVRSFHSVVHVPLLDLLLRGGASEFTIGRPGAGPAVALSFLLTALACGFAALCYAEMATTIPVAGSAYTYTYATLGELTAWMIGWNLILEYAVSNMAVAVGFSAYFNDVLDSLFGFQLPKQLSEPMIMGGSFTGSWFNLPAFLVLMFLTWILVGGIPGEHPCQ
jgi:Amino acid transporters